LSVFLQIRLESVQSLMKKLRNLIFHPPNFACYSESLLHLFPEDLLYLLESGISPRSIVLGADRVGFAGEGRAKLASFPGSPSRPPSPPPSNRPSSFLPLDGALQVRSKHRAIAFHPGRVRNRISEHQ